MLRSRSLVRVCAGGNGSTLFGSLCDDLPLRWNRVWKLLGCFATCIESVRFARTSGSVAARRTILLETLEGGGFSFTLECRGGGEITARMQRVTTATPKRRASNGQTKYRVAIHDSWSTTIDHLHNIAQQLFRLPRTHGVCEGPDPRVLEILGNRSLRKPGNSGECNLYSLGAVEGRGTHGPQAGTPQREHSESAKCTI